MSYFLFNGVSSEELGLMVTKPIIRPGWEELVSEISIPGRPVKAVQRLGTYGSQEMTIQTAVPYAEPELMRKLYSTLRGSGRLWISTAPDEYLNVYIHSLSPDPMALYMGELPVNMTVQPFAQAVEQTVVDLTSANGSYREVYNRGSAFSEPEIRLVPAGGANTVITVNGAEFVLKNLVWWVEGKVEIVVDCEAQVAYYESGGAKISMTEHTYGQFPLLHTGANYIMHDGRVSSMSINVRERWY